MVLKTSENKWAISVKILNLSEEHVIVNIVAAMKSTMKNSAALITVATE